MLEMEGVDVLLVCHNKSTTALDLLDDHLGRECAHELVESNSIDFLRLLGI